MVLSFFVSLFVSSVSIDTWFEYLFIYQDKNLAVIPQSSWDLGPERNFHDIDLYNSSICIWRCMKLHHNVSTCKRQAGIYLESCFLICGFLILQDKKNLLSLVYHWNFPTISEHFTKIQSKCNSYYIIQYIFYTSNL